MALFHRNEREQHSFVNVAAHPVAPHDPLHLLAPPPRVHVFHVIRGYDRTYDRSCSAPPRYYKERERRTPLASYKHRLQILYDLSPSLPAQKFLGRIFLRVRVRVRKDDSNRILPSLRSSFLSFFSIVFMDLGSISTRI